MATNTAVGKKQDASTAITTGNIGQQSVNYATSAGSAGYATSAGSANSATTATQLGSNAGSAEAPVYFSGGKPIACTCHVLHKRTNPASSVYLAASIDKAEYAVPFQNGDCYPITRIGISKSQSNGKRVLLLTWYADGKMYQSSITCD